MDKKNIGILTSGGDAPGMNAAVRAVVRCAIANGHRVTGIKEGYRGLLKENMTELYARSVGEYIQRGGTMLETARCMEFATPEGIKKGAENCRKHGIDSLIVIGGDGSFKGARALTGAGIPTVAMPGTIDNDISCTEYTIGFDTALNTAVDAIDRIRDTSTSHHRCSVIEVMGARAGYIAVETAIATGAEVVLIPEIEFDVQKDIIDVINRGKAAGKKHYIIIMAEGISMKAHDIAKLVEEKTGIEARATVLGHIQRGGKPTVRDRVIATRMGAKAVELIEEGKSNRIVVVKNGEITDIDINEGLDMKKHVSKELYELVRTLSI